VVSLSGADVGGGAGSPPPDLLTKWIELSAFQPIDRDHSAKGTRMHEVWVDRPEHEAIRRRYINERYRLMPYLCTVAEETSHDGLPIDRPLFLEFPHAIENGTPLDLTTGGSEFLFGSRILVAPTPPRKRLPLTPCAFRPAHGTTTGRASGIRVAIPMGHLTWNSAIT
jgi:alpha-glucosidase